MGRLGRRLGELRREAQRGSAALFIAMFAPAMIFMAGLVIDGGSALEARQRAADTAEQAARAAVQECDEGLLRSLSECRITDIGRANRAAQRYRGPGIDTMTLVPISPAGQGFYGVRVTVTITFRTTLLGIVPAFRTMTVTESADAIAVTDL
jgi:Putative Flp pilus-assembly TadE/G-like